MFVLTRTWSKYPRRIYEPGPCPYLVYGSISRTASLAAYGPYVFLLELEGQIEGTFTIERNRVDLVPPGAIALSWELGWACFRPENIIKAWPLGEQYKTITMEQALTMAGLLKP